MIPLSPHVHIPESEVEIHAMRSQGAGGQHVNKVSSAIHLRFDIKTSSLPQAYKDELLRVKDSRISNDGVVTIKAQPTARADSERHSAAQDPQTDETNQEREAAAIGEQKTAEPTEGAAANDRLTLMGCGARPLLD